MASVRLYCAVLTAAAVFCWTGAGAAADKKGMTKGTSPEIKKPTRSVSPGKSAPIKKTRQPSKTQAPAVKPVKPPPKVEKAQPPSAAPKSPTRMGPPAGKEPRPARLEPNPHQKGGKTIAPVKMPGGAPAARKAFEGVNVPDLGPASMPGRPYTPPPPPPPDDDAASDPGRTMRSNREGPPGATPSSPRPPRPDEEGGAAVSGEFGFGPGTETSPSGTGILAPAQGGEAVQSVGGQNSPPSPPPPPQ